MVTLTRIEMERLQARLRFYLWRARHDGSVYWDNVRHCDDDIMIAGLSDAWNDEAEAFPETFTFTRSVET